MVADCGAAWRLSSRLGIWQVMLGIESSEENTPEFAERRAWSARGDSVGDRTGFFVHSIKRSIHIAVKRHSIVTSARDTLP